MAKQIHLHVVYSDHQSGFFPVDPEQGWKINTADRMLIIGRGVPRKMVPLENVQVILIEDCGTESEHENNGPS